MFYQTENSTLLEIPDNAFGFIYKCWIPEYGYGINSVTGNKEKTDVIKVSEDPEEQVWVRQQLPHDYYPKRKKEQERQKIDRNWYDLLSKRVYHYSKTIPPLIFFPIPFFLFVQDMGHTNYGLSFV